MSGMVAAPAKTSAQFAREWGAIAVSLVTLAIFMAALWVAWQTKDPSLQILLGMAGANASTAVAYWLGSSNGSQKKDDALVAASVPAAQTPASGAAA